MKEAKILRSAEVKVNGIVAGKLVESSAGYRFSYLEDYRLNPKLPAVSLTLPKQKPNHDSPYLFPFFYGLLAEGALKQDQCNKLRLDEADHFGRLMKTCTNDTIGTVTIHEEKS